MSEVSSGTARGALAGVRVIDLTANMSGPYATALLAEQGADVVKIEPPGGDVLRQVGTSRQGVSVYYANLNRGKRSIVVDLQQPQGADLVRQLAGQADVFIENYRTGVCARLGLGAQELCGLNPQLVYVSISGFGSTGPLATMPAYDHVIQAMSGSAARQADPRGGEPALVRHGIFDKVTGLFAAQAVTAALVSRNATGRGTRIEVPMLASALHFLWPDGMMNHTCLDDVEVLPPVAASLRLTRTADGFVALATVTDQQWRSMLTAVGLVDRLDHQDFSTAQMRMRHGGAIMREVAARLSAMPTDDVVELLREHDVPCSAVTALDEVAEMPHVVEAGWLEETEHPDLGRVRQPRPAVTFIDVPGPARLPSRRLGEDTEEVLLEFGWTSAAVAELKRDGVVE